MKNVIKKELNEKDIILLYETVRIAHEAVERGCHPFGALLADKDGNILIEKGNSKDLSPCLHAETQVMIEAGKKYSPEFLESCSLYTNFEPCVMCTGAVYWTNVGRIVFGLTEEQLLECTSNHSENPTFNLPCDNVLEHGQRKMIVCGPTNDEKLKEAILRDHINFWN
ncbi:MAG: nucleoside deaminase [Pleomorphochaeta sp.]